jgi:RNA polymerase sigma-70 factor (ECF subfamily)
MEELINLSDQEAVKRAAQGDKEAYGVIYQRYVQQIYRYIFYRTGDHHEAEDLTARVFMRALRHIKNYDERGLPLSAWLYRIAHNLVVNWHRDNHRRQYISLEEIELAHSFQEQPEQNAMQNEERDLLLKIIRHLPAERQQLLILKFVEGLSNAEIGKIMGRSEGAIKSLYHRTLYSLRCAIKNHGYGLQIIDNSDEE